MAQRNLVFLVGLALGVVGASSSARAQAWVGYEHQLDLGLDYNLGISDKVVWNSNKGSPPSRGGRMQDVTAVIDFVPVDRLAVTASLPFEMITYTGLRGSATAHPGGGSYDDGKTHYTLTDLRVGTRYQLVEDPFALTPMIAVSGPVANYETVGNMVAGRHLKALHMGAAIGKVIGNLYGQATYEFSLVERYDRTVETKRFGQNTSDATGTIGYKLLDDRLDINVGANLHVTHGGIDFNGFGTLTAGEKLYHDAYLHEDQFLVGPGLGYQITDSLAVTLAARFFAWGLNTQNANVFGFGLAWNAL